MGMVKTFLTIVVTLVVVACDNSDESCPATAVNWDEPDPAKWELVDNPVERNPGCVAGVDVKGWPAIYCRPGEIHVVVTNTSTVPGWVSSYPTCESLPSNNFEVVPQYLVSSAPVSSCSEELGVGPE
jgi:hypothetical protein